MLVVLGVTGGLGSAGVQIGKAIGSRVIAIASTAAKAERLQALGADHELATETASSATSSLSK
jgi:NADPH:quinone reductase-like Zn-dependent oxidoreductase